LTEQSNSMETAFSFSISTAILAFNRFTISSTADLNYGFDRWTNEDEYYNRFTTGEE